ncbi:hypothetical protein [Eubacterium ventriosum]|uniref:hypothetical protein n=1 Tax=Eubacterium ventriosum TaxID=39496 RepID=UPI00265E0013|nr:hypothetical protein [Eubacterium ventriosum]
MAKFNLRNFVMKTLTSMKDGGEDEYKVMQYALKYYEKGVLTEEDLAEIESWFEEKEETEEPEEEETTEINAN